MRRLKRGLTDWHVTVRGARRLHLFRDTEDYHTFYGLLSDALKRTGTSLHAQCLLGNHAHLCPRAESEQLSELMFRTEQPYSRHHNRKYGLSGHTFDRSYFSKEIVSPRVLAFVSRYIHLNPVRAGLAVRPESYRWSSAGQLLGDADGPIHVETEATLRIFADDPLKARQHYGEFVTRGLAHSKPPPPGGWSALDVWQEEFRWILDVVLGAAERLAPANPAHVASWLATRVGVPPRAIRLVLQDSSTSAISRHVYNFGRRLGLDPELQRRISELGIL